MADDLRKQLREAAAAALALATTGGANTFQSRTHELQDLQLPARRVYTNDEQVEALHDQVEEERRIQLVVECCSKRTADLDDELDLMTKETRVIIAANQNLAGAQFIDLKSIVIDMDGEAEKEVGVARMTFDALVFSASGTPDVAL